jgi:lysophospholipase L1-like esterase
MKRLFLFVIIFLISCAGTSGSAPEERSEDSPVKEITIIGESHAEAFDCTYFSTSCENEGVSGETIEKTLTHLDTRKLKTVILFTGVNSIFFISLADALEKYPILYQRIDSNDIYCIGLPTDVNVSPEKISEFNTMVKELCGEAHYIDSQEFTSDGNGHWLDGMTIDGVHITSPGYTLIAEEIKTRMREQ